MYYISGVQKIFCIATLYREYFLGPVLDSLFLGARVSRAVSHLRPLHRVRREQGIVRELEIRAVVSLEDVVVPSDFVRAGEGVHAYARAALSLKCRRQSPAGFRIHRF